MYIYKPEIAVICLYAHWMKTSFLFYLLNVNLSCTVKFQGLFSIVIILAKIDMTEMTRLVVFRNDTNQTVKSFTLCNHRQTQNSMSLQ